MTQIKALDERIKELNQKNEALETMVKEQQERIIEITTDSAHWERKSLSLSRELGKFSSSQMQQVSQYAELKEAYAVLKSKLQVVMFHVKSSNSLTNVSSFELYFAVRVEERRGEERREAKCGTNTEVKLYDLNVFSNRILRQHSFTRSLAVP